MKFLFYRLAWCNCIVLPPDFNPYSNIIAGIGAGAGPREGRLTGNGGGACAFSGDVDLTAGLVVPIRLGRAGDLNEDGQDTIIGPISDPIIKAVGGKCSVGSGPGVGGLNIDCIGQFRYSGGAGAPDMSTKGHQVAGGGGGGAGPEGTGQTAFDRFGGEPGSGSWSDGTSIVRGGDGATGHVLPVATGLFDAAYYGGGASGILEGAFGKASHGVVVIGYDPVV